MVVLEHALISFLFKSKHEWPKVVDIQSYKMWEVWDGKVVIFSLALYACSIAFKGNM